MLSDDKTALLFTKLAFKAARKSPVGVSQRITEIITYLVPRVLQALTLLISRFHGAKARISA